MKNYSFNKKKNRLIYNFSDLKDDLKKDLNLKLKE
jgi:hypothetical protein